MADDKARISFGEHTSETVVPTTYLSPAECQLLRAYKRWLTDNNFTELILCASCWESRSATPPDIRIRLSVDQVVILCEHELLFGVSPGPAHFPLPVEVPGIELAGVEHRTLSHVEHHTLLSYKRFLAKYRRREALWCRYCEELGRPPGGRAIVTDTTARVECRHRILTLEATPEAPKMSRPSVDILTLDS